MTIETKFHEEVPSKEDSSLHTNENDMFTVLHKIQTDIAEHEALMDRIMRRDAEYDMMKKGYEQKMHNLHHQLHQFQKERDMALQLIKDPLKNKKDATKASIISNTFEERKKKLELQLAEYRKKLDENLRLQNENRSRNDALTKDLKATIESMKSKIVLIDS